MDPAKPGFRDLSSKSKFLAVLGILGFDWHHNMLGWW